MAEIHQKTDRSYGIVPVRYWNGEVQYLLVLQVLGHWDFPKGHQEKQETELQSAVRELFEETGLVCQNILIDLRFDISYHFKSPWEPNCEITKTVTFFIGIIEKSQTMSLQIEEIKDAQWLSYESAQELITFETAKKILGNVQQALNESDTFPPFT